MRIRKRTHPGMGTGPCPARITCTQSCRRGNLTHSLPQRPGGVALLESTDPAHELQGIGTAGLAQPDDGQAPCTDNFTLKTGNISSLQQRTCTKASLAQILKPREELP